MDDERARRVPGWEEGLGWVCDRAVGAVDEGVATVTLDSWQLMAAVARAVMARRELAEEADRLGVAYGEQLMENDRLRALLAEESGHGVD